MTGQVKEEVLSRFGELGVRVDGGAVRFQPKLLRSREFVSDPRQFRFLDIEGNWRELTLRPSSLAFTWCQVPIVYRLNKTDKPALTLVFEYGMTETLPSLSLPDSVSAELFQRSGHIRRIDVNLRPENLLSD